MSGIKTKMMVQTITRLTLALFLGLTLFSSGSPVFADDHGQANVRHANHHYYRNGKWYRHGWFGWGVREPVITVGEYVETLPPAYSPVVVQGATYYYGDNMYFRPLPEGGYTVVSAPGS